MAFIEIILYSLNEYIVTELLFVNDVGGSMIIHAFGAYFGLSVSYMLGEPFNDDDNTSTYHSDLFSMIGTIFLVCFVTSLFAIFLFFVSFRFLFLTLLQTVRACLPFFWQICPHFL